MTAIGFHHCRGQALNIFPLICHLSVHAIMKWLYPYKVMEDEDVFLKVLNPHRVNVLKVT